MSTRDTAAIAAPWSGVVEALVALAALGVGAPFTLAAAGALALARGGSSLVAILCAIPATPLATILPPQAAALGGLPAAVAALTAVSLEREVRRAERPMTTGPSRAIAAAALVALGVVALRRLVLVVVPELPRACLPGFDLLLVVACAAALARSPRAARVSRGRTREAALWGVAAAVAGVGEVAPLAVMALAARGGGSLLPRGAAAPAAVLAALLRSARASLVPLDAAVLAASVVGLFVRSLGTVAFPAFGARLRLLERARSRLARHEGVHTHRVALSLAEAAPRFLVDWHRPPVQLFVERIGVMRATSALPAPELVEALEVAPDEVLAFDEVHPYTVGAVDVHGAQRSLEARGATAAALLRDAESREVAGVLYVLGGTGAPLAPEEAAAFGDVARAVSAALGAGTEPAIAARLRG